MIPRTQDRQVPKKNFTKKPKMAGKDWYELLDFEKTSRDRHKLASCLMLNINQEKTQPIVKFFFYYTVPKHPEKVFPKLENTALDTSEKTYLSLRKIKTSQKSIW